jgi:hypothetical protein
LFPTLAGHYQEQQHQQQQQQVEATQMQQPAQQQQQQQATAGTQQGGAEAPPRRHDTTLVEGKLFLGGLDLQSTKASVSAYCCKWCGCWLLDACRCCTCDANPPMHT